MKNLFLCFGFLTLISCSPKRENVTVISDVGIFDGNTYKPNMHLAFDSDGIIEISSEPFEFKGATVINGKGKTIIPPLLNAHVHAWNKGHLKEAQDAGVFALLDMHNTDETAKAMRDLRNHIVYAHYYSSGPGATVPGGHGTEYGFYVPTINDSVSSEKFTLDRIKNGADYIKILREPIMNTIDFKQTDEVIRTAHAGKKLVVAHVSFPEDAARLSAQQIDGFAHLWFSKPRANAGQWDSILKSKAFVIPTLYVTKKVLEEWEQRPWRDEWLEFEDVLKEVKLAYDKGMIILAGTDAPNNDFNFGTDLYEELKLLSKAGIPNIDVLKAATTNISTCFKLKEFGALEKGKPASFILINGNPLNNINDIEKMEQIWKLGREIK